MEFADFRILKIRVFRKLNIHPKTLLVLIILLLISAFSIAYAQSFPQDFNCSYRTDVLLDAGQMWYLNSTFHPLFYPLTNKNQITETCDDSFKWISFYIDKYAQDSELMRKKSEDGIVLKVIPGIGIAKQYGVASDYSELAIQPFVWIETMFHKNWYSRIYFRASNNTLNLPHYSGVEKDIPRGGFTTAEFDQLAIGFRNEWAAVEYGRGREIWGPMSEDNLLLSGNAPPYERLMFQINHKRFAYRWFFGYLETVYVEGSNINRYIVGKALEYRNDKNLVLSAGEVTVLSGPNRSIDMAYLNPLSIHIELETNDKINDQSDNHANTILFANIDWMLHPSVRFSFSFALDEFQIDQIDRNNGAADALGYLARIAWTPLRDPLGLTLFTYGIRNDTYLIQHNYGYDNFVNHGELLSHPIGNDAYEIASGVRVVFHRPIILELKYGRRGWGDNSLLNAPYTPYDPGFSRLPFPSGRVKTNNFLAFQLNCQPIKNFTIGLAGHLDIHHTGDVSALEEYTLIIRYQKPLVLLDL